MARDVERASGERTVPGSSESEATEEYTRRPRLFITSTKARRARDRPSG